MKVRIGLLALALVVGLAAPADAKPVFGDEIERVTATAPVMHPGQTAWLSMVWEASDTVDEFAVTVRAPEGFAVAYPDGGTDTSLFGSASLAKRTQDFTAFRLSVPYGATGPVELEVHATWVRRGNNGNGGGNGAGTPGSLATTLSVPLEPYTGPALAATPGPLAVRQDAPGWVELPFVGGAPRLDGVQVTVAGPPELVVTYPGEGTFAGLSQEPSLLGGAADHAAVHLDASALEPGTHPLTVTVAYDAGGPATVTLEVPLAVS